MVDSRGALEIEVANVLAVADDADHGHESAPREVAVRADGLDALDDRLIGACRPLFHHDHHLCPLESVAVRVLRRASVLSAVRPDA